MNNNHQRRRIDLLANTEDFQCVLLAAMGFSDKAIQSHLPAMTRNMIQTRLRAAGNIKRRFYRDGQSRFAQIVLNKTSKNIASHLKELVHQLPAPQKNGLP